MYNTKTQIVSSPASFPPFSGRSGFVVHTQTDDRRNFRGVLGLWILDAYDFKEVSKLKKFEICLSSRCLLLTEVDILSLPGVLAPGNPLV